jgi:transcriptional regulator with XRE-family HTH domain
MRDLSELEYKTAANLIRIRKERSLTQTDLALAIKSKQAAISRIENLTSIPSLKLIEKIAKALNYEVEISFKLLAGLDTYEPVHTQTGKQYICVFCEHKWFSGLDQGLIQCPKCHKKEGIQYSLYNESLGLAKDIKDAPPLKKLPPIWKFKRRVPKMYKLVLGMVTSSPSPKVPIKLFFKIMAKTKEAKKESVN